VRTIFNLLGPLTNPANARRQLVGVSDPQALETIAGALAILGVERALVVASEDGLDEISICAPTRVVEVNGEETRRYTLRPEDVGVKQTSTQLAERDCGGGTPEENATIVRALLEARAGSASTDLAIINAGAAIYAAGRAQSIAAGVEAARAALADGRAADALERFVEATWRYASAEAPT
jgi:anthranilate phosphoribosyltransferase